MTPPNHDDRIAEIEAILEETGRRCLRLIETGDLNQRQVRTLAKWMFGCMNQRFTIRRRVKERGRGELAKVLKFVEQACALLLELS